LPPLPTGSGRGVGGSKIRQRKPPPGFAARPRSFRCLDSFDDLDLRSLDHRSLDHRSLDLDNLDLVASNRRAPAATEIMA